MQARHLLASATLMATMALTSQAAQAAAVTWTLDNVIFYDGGTASGSFTFDAATNTYTAWSITTTATTNAAADGGYPLNGATYTTNTLTGASSSSYLNPYGLTVKTAGGADSLSLVFNSVLTGAGGTIALKTGSENAGFGFESRSLESGSVSAVPLPGALPMFVAGLGILGLVRGRRRFRG